jgi:hypothetical protein
MTSITLENINGRWSVVTPRQVYRFPSLELAHNFYTSLMDKLQASDSECLQQF